ncbi:MAG: hypothetical protein PHT44_01495 [Candidatus Portnoybacteria bacterium]|nr:hypothetical protein [Candidatus Portnoybacteria bacterium]MDD4982731.1 hypothetical protein [Candidatus Portnoybacteria bacterium]
MNTKNHSRKLSLLVAVFVLLTGIFIGGYLVLKSGRVSAGQIDNILNAGSTNPEICNPDPGDSNKDSDNDGLKDWQEIQIYQSNPCKADTDGDGYLDGEEIASGYDPIKKAPGDELPGTLPKGPRPLPANLTSALSSMLAQQIAAGKIDSFDQQGQLLSSYELEKYPAIQQAVQQIISAEDQLFAPDPIDDGQIKTTADNSERSIRSYAQKMHDGLSSGKKPISSKTEAQILLDAIKSNDFSEMAAQFQSYQRSYQVLKELTVPSDLLLLHTQIMGVFSSLTKIYQAIENIESDPLKTNLALQKYTVLMEETIQWAKDFEITTKNHF